MSAELPLDWTWKPFLVGCWLLLALLYGFCLWHLHRRQTGAVTWKHPLFFSLAAFSSLLLVSSPVDALGQHWLFTVRMFEYICLIYGSGLLLLLSLPAALLEHLNQSLLKRLLLPFSDLAQNSLLFNSYFFIWHLPDLLQLALQSAWINEFQLFSFVISGALMVLPLYSAYPRLRLPFSRQMFYLTLLILGQVPVFAFLTLSSEQLYLNYSDQPGMYFLSAYGDQQVSGWFLKGLTLHIFAIHFLVIFLQWNWQQRRQDYQDNFLAVENFQLSQRAPRREG